MLTSTILYRCLLPPSTTDTKLFSWSHDITTWSDELFCGDSDLWIKTDSDNSLDRRRATPYVFW